MGVGNGEGSIFADNGRTRLEIGGTTLYSIAQITRGWNEAEDEANARLIAAAPDLLAALRTCIEDMESMIGLSDFGSPEESDFPLAIARAAVAKAKGGDA
jgi:hypothetical protein